MQSVLKILIVLLIFWFSVFASGSQIGSPSKMYDLLEAAQARNNDAPTKGHSYVTIRSLGALKFAILSILEYSESVHRPSSYCP